MTHEELHRLQCEADRRESLKTSAEDQMLGVLEQILRCCGGRPRGQSNECPKGGERGCGMNAALQKAFDELVPSDQMIVEMTILS